MPRILVLSSEFPPGPGGIGTHAHQLALQLHSRGWRVTVTTPQEMSSEHEIQQFGEQQPFDVHRLKQFGTAPLKLAYRFAVVSSIILRDRPSLIVASGERMVWLAALVQQLHRIPFVAVGHAMEFNVPARWQRAVNRRTFGSASGVVCVSEYTRARMDACGIHCPVSEVIPNGADDTRFRILPPSDAQAFRRAHDLENAAVLITVGSVHERKGQDVVIRALPQVLDRIPNLHYLIVGMPSRRDVFAELAERLGVADRVHFLGVVEPQEVVRALNAADLFVMASQHTPNGDFEGFGIAVVEAALCGRAAVVSDNSGVVEAIEPGETGLVARISDPASTAERIIDLLGDRQRLIRMENLAHKRAAAEKTWSRRGEQYDRLLRRLTQIRHAQRSALNEVPPGVD